MESLYNIFTAGATKLTLISDSTTGITDYYNTTSGTVFVGSKNTYSWKVDGKDATGYSFFNDKDEFLGDGGNDGIREYLNLRETFAATGKSKDTHGGQVYVVEKGSFKEFDTDGTTVLFEESWSFDYAGAGHSSGEGTFLGVTETRDGATVTFDGN